MKPILLAVTGLSPQVITETLYALHHEQKPWPVRIEVLTTTVGRQKIQSGLQQQGHLSKLCQQLQRPEPELEIKVIPDGSGHEVEDARSLDDHAALANFIIKTVRDLTENPDISIHASIAGGRKTMTFFLGYAMSLFGRKQDRLSHVLITDGLEAHPEFYYPPVESKILTVRSVNGEKQVDASQVKVILADIPFIRQRNNLPSVITNHSQSLDIKALTELTNLGDSPDDIRLTLNLPECRLEIGSSNQASLVQVKLSDLPMAFYLLSAQSTLQNNAMQYRPNHKQVDIALADCMIECLHQVYQKPLPASRKEQLDTLHDNLQQKSVSAFENGINTPWFDGRRNEISKELQKYLPNNLASLLMPTQLWDEDGARVSDPSGLKGGAYGIDLKPEQIHIIDHTAS